MTPEPLMTPELVGMVRVYSNGDIEINATSITRRVFADALRRIADSIDATAEAIAADQRCQFGSDTHAPCTEAAIDMVHGVMLCRAHYDQARR